MRYYKITALGGHCGARRSIDLIFYIEAENMFEAMTKCRKMPAVKHTKPYAIKMAVEISKEEYIESREGYSAYDAYRSGDEEDIRGE